MPTMPGNTIDKRTPRKPSIGFISCSSRTLLSKALFSGSLDASKPPFSLEALEVAGVLRAVAGMSVSGDRLICEFGAIADDDLTAASPGEFLFFEMIRKACEDGFGLFDFSVGDEAYKRLWCDIEVRQFDALVPLTVKGRIAAALWRGKGRAKHLVKNNPTLWRVAKGLRRYRHGAAAPEGSQSADDSQA